MVTLLILPVLGRRTDQGIDHEKEYGVNVLRYKRLRRLRLPVQSKIPTE